MNKAQKRSKKLAKRQAAAAAAKRSPLANAFAPSVLSVFGEAPPEPGPTACCDCGVPFASLPEGTPVTTVTGEQYPAHALLPAHDVRCDLCSRLVCTSHPACVGNVGLARSCAANRNATEATQRRLALAQGHVWKSGTGAELAELIAKRPYAFVWKEGSHEDFRALVDGLPRPLTLFMDAPVAVPKGFVLNLAQVRVVVGRRPSTPPSWGQSP